MKYFVLSYDYVDGWCIRAWNVVEGALRNDP